MSGQSARVRGNSPTKFRSNGKYSRPDKWYAVCKRGMDLIGAIVLLVLCSPLMAIISLIIKLDSPGPVIFRQERVGKAGKPFTFYKFRSMFSNSDPAPHQDFVRAFIRGEAGRDSGGNSSGVLKLTNDSRVTRVGRLLRHSSLDELPQLFNVLMGDLSLVGPRPAIPYELSDYEEWHKKRLLVKPGVTGLWQVRGRSSVPFDEMVRLDLQYIKNQSMKLDMMILLKTIPAVVSGKGAE